jgi:cyanophycinase-like exopeptidase
MSGPRILAIMGSGETAPTMAKVHRALFERFERRTAGATLIDTPYGFQENADDLTARIVDYFRVSIGREMTVASYRTRDVGPVESATALARIGDADYVLSGPGSPSYALRQWADGPIPAALATKLSSGGIVTMASAAALTVGVVTIPVYEIYKVGEAPAWLPGLDLLGPATGLSAAVVPHYDNAEGGNHDTRFCYIGERRLRMLERAMPERTFVLGVDSHTALVLDLERRTATVLGLGGVTVRADGRSRVFPNGTEVPIDDLAAAADEIRAGSTDELADRSTADREPGGAGAGRADGADVVGGPLRDEVAGLEGAIVAALGDRDPGRAVGGLLALDQVIERRVGAGEDSPDLQAARATYRSLIVRLGESVGDGSRPPHDTVGPFVEALIEVRARARNARDWTTADLVRDRLVDAGVELHDEPTGTSWSVRTVD